MKRNLKYDSIFDSRICVIKGRKLQKAEQRVKYEGGNFNSGNYLFTTDTK